MDVSVTHDADNRTTAALPEGTQTPGDALRVLWLEGEAWHEFAPRWDACLRGDHLGLSHALLDCARHLHMDGYRMTPMAVLDEAGDTAGVATCFRSITDASDLGSPGLRRVVGAIRTVFRNFLRYEVIEVGLPAGVGHPARTRDVRTFEAMLDAAMAEARRIGNALVVVRDLDPVAAPETDAMLARKDFEFLPMPATMMVPMPFGSFDGYVTQMRAKYRRLLNERMAKTRTIRCEVVDDFAPLVPEMIRLWRDLYSRADRYHRLQVTAEYLEAVSRLSGSRCLLLRREDDSIAAFGVMYLDGETLRGTIGGFTREAALDEGVYFRMLYETVRFGADHGFRNIALGQSAAGPKMSIGAVPVELSARVWHPSGITRAVLSRLIGTFMRPKAPPSDRHVFHKSPPRPVDSALTDFGPTASTSMSTEPTVHG